MNIKAKGPLFIVSTSRGRGGRRRGLSFNQIVLTLLTNFSKDRLKKNLTGGRP